MFDTALYGRRNSSMKDGKNWNEKDLLTFVQKAVQTPSLSDEEEELARLVLAEMRRLGYDEAFIDSTGNVVGRTGNGPKIIHFDSHLDAVKVDNPESWQVPPFSGAIVDGCLWGRGSVDMKSALGASLYAAARARERGYTEGKTVYVTGTVCEEYCDGGNLKHLYEELSLKPDCCVICEPSGNVITLGHKGKAQVRIKTRGVSAHGSAPEKGVNAVYEMAEIISRVDALNRSLYKDGVHGTVVLSDISCVSASLNAVPSECSIYLDRRLAPGETVSQVEKEMEHLTMGKNAFWETGTLRHRTWTGKDLVYEPLHNPWRIEKDHPLTQALVRAYKTVFLRAPEKFDFWDFGTNAVTPVAMGIPTIGFGPGDYKLAHMTDERCPVAEIEEACEVYCQLIREF
jgi:putative selenium metabolism hydrolase